MDPNAIRRAADHSVEPITDARARALVKRFQAGETAAFERLYLAYFGPVHSYMSLVLRNPHDAEDATQQVFTSVFDNLARYEDRGLPFRAWLFTIARHQGMSTRKGRGDANVMDPQLLDQTRDAIAPARSTKTLDLGDDALVRILEMLPPVQRQILLLRHVFDFRHREIAIIVERSPEAVRQLHTRATKVLRARLEPLRRSGGAELPAAA